MHRPKFVKIGEHNINLLHVVRVSQVASHSGARGQMVCFVDGTFIELYKESADEIVAALYGPDRTPSWKREHRAVS